MLRWWFTWRLVLTDSARYSAVWNVIDSFWIILVRQMRQNLLWPCWRLCQAGQLSFIATWLARLKFNTQRLPEIARSYFWHSQLSNTFNIFQWKSWGKMWRWTWELCCAQCILVHPSASSGPWGMQIQPSAASFNAASTGQHWETALELLQAAKIHGIKAGSRWNQCMVDLLLRDGLKWWWNILQMDIIWYNDNEYYYCYYMLLSTTTYYNCWRVSFWILSSFFNVFLSVTSTHRPPPNPWRCQAQWRGWEGLWWFHLDHVNFYLVSSRWIMHL